MPISRIIGLVAFLLSAVSPAWAQLEEVVVTGSRLSGEDYSRIPAVVLQRRADFLVQAIRLTNDTRLPDARKRELYQTIRDMVADAAKQRGIALGYGDEFLIPVTATDYEVPLSNGNKSDTSSAEIFVKLALSTSDDVAKSISTVNAFIKQARLTGRTEVEPIGEISLSLVKPEKYRFDIIAKIAEDAQRVRDAVNKQCEVHISGLSNRVSWRRSDVSELTLYVPYEIELQGCK